MVATFDSNRPYSAIKGGNPGYIWFRVPKVGSSSLRKLLHQYTTVEADAYSLKITQDDATTRFTFAFTRNPFDRLVSTWHDKVVQTETDEKKYFQPCFNKDFTFFINYLCRPNSPLRNEGHVRPQSYFIPGNIDFIGHLESFTEDVRHVMQRLGHSNPDIPHLKAWPRPHYSTYYTAETRALVENHYQKDLKRFGYQFQPPACHS